MEKTAIANTLSLAIENHKEGNLEEARVLYRTILNSNPDHPDANHNMGILLSQLNKNEEAISILKKQ